MCEAAQITVSPGSETVVQIHRNCVCSLHYYIVLTWCTVNKLMNVSCACGHKTHIKLKPESLDSFPNLLQTLIFLHWTKLGFQLILDGDSMVHATCSVGCQLALLQTALFVGKETLI